MSRKTVKILTECTMCTILTVIMMVGAIALYTIYHGDSRETPVKEQNK